MKTLSLTLLILLFASCKGTKIIPYQDFGTEKVKYGKFQYTPDTTKVTSLPKMPCIKITDPMPH